MSDSSTPAATPAAAPADAPATRTGLVPKITIDPPPDFRVAWLGMATRDWTQCCKHRWVQRDGQIGCLLCKTRLSDNRLNESVEGRKYIEKLRDLLSKHCPTTGGGPDQYVTEGDWECVGPTEWEELKTKRAAAAAKVDHEQAFHKEMERRRAAARRGARERAERAFEARNCRN